MNGPDFLNDGQPARPSSPEDEPMFLEHDFLDDPLLHLPCYEPAGLNISLTVRDLLRHLLIVGQTGAGKTTLNNRLLQNLISYRSSTTGEPSGLLILDAQGDGTVARIRAMAEKVGRQDDLRVLSATEGFFDPLGRLTSFADLDLVVSSLMSATNFTSSLQSDNSYWAENTRLLVECGLTVLLLTESRISFHPALDFLSRLLVQGREWSDEVKSRVERFDQIVASAPEELSPGICSKLTLVQATLHGWKSLDAKTRGILQTCVGLVLAPLLSAQALPYWDSRKGNQIHPGDALEGKIIILSVSGASEPETAALLSRLVKIDFYRDAQARSGHQALSGIVMDEFPLCVTTGSPRWSDVANLATLRGKGVFVIAATQGLVNLDVIIGSAQTQALLTNFSSLILLRSQETGFLYQVAEKILGRKSVPPRPHGLLGELGNLILMHPSGLSPDSIPVCPEGSLARLEAHQAYVALANGYRTADPVWLAPLFFSPAPPSDKSVVDRDLALLRMTDRKSAPAFSEPEIMEVCSLQLYHVLLAHPRRARTVVTADDFLKKLHEMKHVVGPTEVETIPCCWRQACLNLAAKLPKSFKIIELRCVNGRLKVEFVARATAFAELDRRSRQWQWSVYPSRIRIPNRSDFSWLERNFSALLADAAAHWQRAETKKENSTEDPL